ncbi:TraB/GumN family protein [Candidatus Woesearchaeota archaeon]|nr:TraB/GumN family protein [Candidatus Woesearchaeota archaeon]
MKHGNLTIIGTSHIAKDSVAEVERIILAEKPDIVAVELDHARLHALLSEQKQRFSLSMVKQMGIAGTLFFAIGSLVQRKLGKMIGAVPGEEMKTAVKAARQNGIRIALIDQPLDITMKNISRISLKEKLRLAADLLLGIGGLGEEKELAKIDIDLSKTPSEQFVKLAMKKLQERYPELYKALVKDRNIHMAKTLSRIMASEPQSRIVAVVGAGHEKEIVRMAKAQN